MPFVMSTNPVVTVSGSDPIVSVDGSTPIISIKNATIDQKGAVQLEDSTASTSIIKAATPKSVKDSYDHTTTVSGALKVYIDEKSAIGHDHDERYYTESELDAGQLDDRYYTESEVDNLITAVSGTTDHSVLDNLDYASSGHTGFQPSGNYATDSELTTLSGALKNDIDGKADTVHVHDDRYYTESEVDTISGSLSAEIDTDISTHKGDADAHHPQTHTIASHDTTASGSELNTLTDNSIADALHRHSELVASDGSPDPAVSVDASGSIGIGTISPNAKLEVVDIDKDTKFEVTTYSNGVFKFLDAPSFNHKKAYGSEDSPEEVVDGTLLGSHNFRGYQGGAFRTGAQIISLVDTTPSGIYVPGELRLITYDNASNNHFLVMRNDGAVGIGTTTPGGKLCVNGGVTVGSDTDAGDNNLRVEGDADVIGNITTSGTVDGVDVAALKSDFDFHDHDDRYYTEAEVDTISGSLNTKIDGKADTSHTHDDRYYTETEVDTISGSLNTKVDGKADTVHGHTESDITDLDKYTEAEVDTISGSLNTKIDGKSDTNHLHDDRYYTETELDAGQLDNRYYTESEVDTISGSLNTKIDGKADTSHLHDDRYYTETEVDTISGSLQTKIDGKADTAHTHDDRYYTESEVDTISGSLQNDIDTHGHVSTEIIVSKINTPTYGTLQEWINNTQSAGRMSGGNTTAHTETITGVTEGGAGSGEFKVAGDHTACFIFGATTLVEGSTNNDGYYTVASGVVYSGGTTTVPVDEAVGAVADGITYNGTVDVADGTGFIKATDSDIGETVSFDIHAETSIVLTDTTTNYLYVDYNTGTPNIKVTTDKSIIEKNRQFPLSMTYRNGPRTWTCECGIYLPNKTRLDHDRILVLRGYERATGGEISEVGTRSIASTAGEFFRGTTEINTTSKNSTTDKLTTVYYDGADWVWTENLTQIDNTYYNDTATGLVELGISKYAVHWICIDYLSNLYVVYGRDSYSLSEAQLAGVPSLMPVVAFEFGIVAAKVIIQKTAASFTELISAYTQLIPTATPAVHNNLSGLNDNDYKHLTATEKTKFDSIEEGATADQTKADIDGLAITTVGTLDTGNADAVVTKATVGDINTGTEAIKVVTPDTLAGSNLGTKNVVVKVIADDTTLTTGNGKTHFTVTEEQNGMNLVSVGIHVYTSSSSGLPTFQIHNLTDTVDMLTTEITIDETENDSKDAATPAVIDTDNDDVATGDVLRFDCDIAGTGTKGMEIRMGFRLP